MSEVLAAERWREEKLPPCTAVSMHAGKLHHSVKYKHPSAQKMVDTNWRTGIDAPVYQVHNWHFRMIHLAHNIMQCYANVSACNDPLAC